MSHERQQRGSALMLVPAGVLILLMLGAIAVDSALAYMTQRELENRAMGAANDAVTIALQDASLQLGKAAAPDPVSAEDFVHSRLDGMQVGRMLLRPEDIRVRTDVAAKSVTVHLEGDASYIFSPAIRGGRRFVHVAAESTAELQFRTPD